MSPDSRVSGLANSLRAELIKLATLPALSLTVPGTWAAAAVLGVARASIVVPGQAGTTSALVIGLSSIGYAQAGLIIFGVLAASSEYSGGQIRATLVSVPRRTELEISKLVTLTLVALPLGCGAVVIAVASARLGLGHSGTPLELSKAAQAIAGATVYLTLTALSSFAVAVVVRGTLPAVALLLSYYFIAGPILRGRATVSSYLPDTAGLHLWSPNSDARGAIQGGVIVGLWTLAAVMIATISFHRRDA